ncbi:MAG: aldehyde ferredoxin oxidoreductase C-terminal domain-containing protein, partial [Anaerolineales bacterium]|nr:aldehyde ferredoxin oxidoreductase C-terminal domain-containing protein [Anaerolineales bacterium]
VEPEMLAQVLNSVCGFNWSIEDMMNCGERGWNLKRVINNRLGLTRKNDCLPKALQVPYEDDIEGENGYIPDLESMLSAYYHVRGWNPEIGFPSQEKLRTLGLDWVEFYGDDIQSL